MKTRHHVAIVLFLNLFSCAIHAQPFNSTATYDICFTPGEDCTARIVNALNQAKQTVFIQAYSFTSAPIAKAVVSAERRGVAVNVILDKSQFKAEKYSASIFLQHAGVPVWIDSKPAIAHNKIMIIDASTIITGSFNFTKAAQEKNAENLLIIHDAGLANRYLANWRVRQQVATPLMDYHPKPRSKHSSAAPDWLTTF